jgi:hypothetical protein
MKNGLFSPKTLLALIGSAVFAGSILVACTKENTMSNGNGTATSYSTRGDASGSKMNPPVTTSATATHMGSYNTTTNVWQYNVTWTGLSGVATVVEVHGPASATVNGNLLFTLEIMAPGVSGSAFGNAVLTEQQEAYLIANNTYYTVVTASHPTGEIRGNIVASAQ